MDVVRCSAPARCGIIGNPTDMYGGAVLSCSVDRRARVLIQPDDRLIVATNGEELVINSREDLALRGDLFDIARSVLDYCGAPCDEQWRFRLSYSSDIPMKAGLGGSTSLMVAIVFGLSRFRGERLGLYQVAELARYIELNYLRVVCGYQDAYMSTFGWLNYMDFRGKEFYRSAADELYATIERLDSYVSELPFILVHSGVSHLSDAVHRPLRERWLEGDRQVRRAYEEIGNLAREGKRALLLGDWERLGWLMNRNHAIQRDLGGSGDANERLITFALEHGALGAKLAGAGDGGTIIAIHPEPDKLAAMFQDAGSECILRPVPVPGVQLDGQ